MKSETSCALEPWLLAVLVSGASALLMAIPLVLVGRALFKRQLANAIALQEAITEEKIDAGLDSLVQLGHPMIVISVDNFMSLSFETLGKLHEGMRDSGMLLTLDTIESVMSFKQNGKKLVLFSYQWLSWSRSGPNEVQNCAMQNSVRSLCAAQEISQDDVYIWLDILSIPQCHPALKQLAVYSLYVYAGLSDYLLIIAPPSVHDNTKQIADADSYKSRVWCRAEQLAHFCKSGMSTMFLCTSQDGHLEPLSADWITAVVRVFDGEMTCCRLLHELNGTMMKCDKESLVSTLLGLYFEVYTSLVIGEGSEAKIGMQNLITTEKDRIFPANFSYVTKKGTEQRELFGDMIQRVEKVIENDHARASKRCMASGTDSKSSRGSRSVAIAAPADIARILQSDRRTSMKSTGTVGSESEESAVRQTLLENSGPVLLGSQGKDWKDCWDSI